MMFSQQPKSPRTLKRLAKALNRLHVYPGWSETLLVANTILMEISRRRSNSEDPDGISSDSVLRNTIFLDIITCDPSIYIMKHPNSILRQVHKSSTTEQLCNCLLQKALHS